MSQTEFLERLGRSRYLSLTTFRRDGRAVPTAVWFVIDGEEVLIVSLLDTGKVKRIRNSGRVTIAPCDVRGRVAPDAPTVEGVARLLDEAGTARARQLYARRYVTSRIGNALGRLAGRQKPRAGIAVTF